MPQTMETRPMRAEAGRNERARLALPLDIRRPAQAGHLSAASTSGGRSAIYRMALPRIVKKKNRKRIEGVCVDFLASRNSLSLLAPVLIQEVALVHARQGGHGFGVGQIPTHAAALES